MPMPKTVIWTVVLMGALCTAGPAHAHQFWLTHEFKHFCAYPRIQKGYDSYKKGKYDRAARLFKDAVNIEPHNFKARKALAQTCLKLKDLSCAKDQGEALNRLNPKSPEGNFILARIADLEKRPTDAIHAAEAALRLTGLSPQKRAQLMGILTDNLLRTQNLNQARAELLKLTETETDPRQLKAAYDRLIDLYFIHHQIREGMELYHEYIKHFGPADTHTRIYWSNLLAQHNHIESAYDMIASLPSRGGVLKHKVNLLEKLGHYRKAADLLYLKGSKEERRTSSYWLRMATLYNKAGDTHREFEVLATGIQTVKENAPLYQMAVERLIHLKAYNRAAKWLKAEIREHPSKTLQKELAKVYEKENRYADASRQLYPLWKHFKGIPSERLHLTHQLLYLLEKEKDWPLYLKVMMNEARILETKDHDKTQLPVPAGLFTGHHLQKKIKALETAYPFLGLPEDERFAFTVGLIHLERLAHQEDRAKRMVSDLAQWVSMSPEQLEHVATLAYDLGMCTEAMLAAKQLINQSPKSVHARLILGYCYQKEDKPGQAIKYLKEAARLRPELATDSFQVGLGALYEKMGDKDQALAQYEMALRQKFNPDLALKMAHLFFEQHHDQKALHLLSKIDPQGLDRKKASQFWALKGMATEHTGDLTAAAEDYQKSLSHWETAQIWGQLGYTYIRQGKKPSAIHAFRQALTLEPDKGRYRASLAYLLAETGKPAQAATAFRQAIQTDPDDISLYEGLGYAELKAGNHQAATQAFKDVIDHYADRPGTEDPKTVKKIYRIQQTLDNINRQWHVNFAEVMRIDNSRFGPQPSLIANTSYSGFGILSTDYRVAQGLGPQKTDISVHGRLLWANQNRSLAVEKDLTQAGLGLSVKPLGDYNLRLSMERMFKVGSDTQDDWMARASISFGTGAYWHPTQTAWNYYDLYLDGAYLLKSGQHYLTSNLNWGRAFTLRDAWGLVPYLTCGAVDSDGNTWIDAGVGITLAIWGLQGRYHAHRLLSRITLEGRQQLAGNSKDEHTVRLKYEMHF